MKIPSNLAMDVRSMEVHKPLLIQPGATKQIIQVVASHKVSSGMVEVKFSSQDGNISQDHAHCAVIFGDGNQWQSNWMRNAYLVKARMDHLIASSVMGLTHKILRPMVYKLFSALVTYDPKYQGMDEVYLDSNLLEATAHVKFATDDSDGIFTHSPYWIDSIAHLSGFVLNGADTTPEDCVFISHGWKSMKIVAQLSASVRYQSYVRMQETDTPGVLSGDVYFFEDDQVVAVCEDLKFQRIKRTILDHLLPRTSPGGIPTQQPVATDFTKRAAFAAIQQRERPVSKSPERTIDMVLAAIASEVGVELAELSDDALFSDLGVDSLLTLSIVAKLGSLLGEDVPATLFNDCLSVQDLRQYFALESSGASTPSADSLSDESSIGLGSKASTNLSTPAPEPTEGYRVDELRKIIAQEVGLQVHEIDEATPLAEYGVDSLLSLSILATVNMAGMDLPSSFLIDYPTLEAIREALGDTPARPTEMVKAVQEADENTPQFKAEAVLLQRGSNSQAPALFLLPDGSGSAGSYMVLPQLDTPGAVYGLNSPFLSSPESFQVPLKAAAAMYVTEIRRVQPRGPYRLGGWSIGGAYAFEAASELAQTYGEQVEMLVLIDAPCPKELPPLPLETIDLLSELGVMDELKAKGSQARERVKKHFKGSVNALRQYQATAIPTGLGPKTVLALWAEKGVWETTGDAARSSHEGLRDSATGRNAASDWIMDPRRSHDANGWDKLLPGTNIRCQTVAGNHFSMMRKPAVVDLGQKVAHAVSNLG